MVGTKIVIIAVSDGFGHRLPAGLFLSEPCIITLTIDFKGTHHLAVANAVIIKCVIQLNGRILIRGQILYARKRCIVFIIEQIAVFFIPSLLQVTAERICIGKFGIGVTEVSTALGSAFISGLVCRIGIQTVSRLIFSLLSKAVQRGCTQVDIVAYGSVIDDIHFVVIIPCTILGRCNYTRHNANGICGSGVNCLCTVNPVAYHSQLVVFINRCFGKSKIVIYYLQIGNIHIKIGIKLSFDFYLSQHTDTFCKLKQELERSRTLICTWKHIRKTGKLIGNWNRLHIQSEGV